MLWWHYHKSKENISQEGIVTSNTHLLQQSEPRSCVMQINTRPILFSLKILSFVWKPTKQGIHLGLSYRYVANEQCEICVWYSDIWCIILSGNLKIVVKQN